MKSLEDFLSSSCRLLLLSFFNVACGLEQKRNGKVFIVKPTSIEPKIIRNCFFVTVTFECEHIGI